MSKDRYEAVKAPTNTDAEKARAIEYHLKIHHECVIALAQSALRLHQLGVPIPKIEIHPDQLRLDVI